MESKSGKEMDISSTLNVSTVIGISKFAVYYGSFFLEQNHQHFLFLLERVFKEQRLLLVIIFLEQRHRHFISYSGSTFKGTCTYTCGCSSIMTSTASCTLNESGFDTDSKQCSIRFSYLYFICYFTIMLCWCL